MPAAIFARRLAKLEQTASRDAARAGAELLKLATDEELEGMIAILTRNNAQEAHELPAEEAERYMEIATRFQKRRGAG